LEGSLATEVIQAAVQVWQCDDTSADGLALMRKAHTWLASELEADLADPLRTAPEDSLGALGDLIGILDGAAVSLGRLGRLRDELNLNRAGYAVFERSAVGNICAATAGVPPDTMQRCFRSWWNRELNREMFISRLASESVREHRRLNELRVKATWGTTKPPNGLYPSWRVEGSQQKVPWFLPDSAVEMAKEAAPNKVKVLTDHGRFNQGPIRAKSGDEHGPQRITNGMCMFCGSNHMPVAKQLFPGELGGSFKCNEIDVCSLCEEWQGKLGPERWSQVLLTPPEEVAESYWQSQKKANERLAAGIERLKEQQKEFS